MRIKEFKYANFVIFQILLVWFFLFFYNENNKKDHITNDVVVYYGYLPATFICKDITLINKCEKGRYWLVTTEEGKKVFKMTMGMAILYSPFFLIAHNVAPLLHDPQDGYSATYQVLLAISSIFYLIIGLHLLRKVLSDFFSDKITALVIFSIYFGTNLFWYSIGDFLMPHSYIFALVCMVMYLSKKIHNKPSSGVIFMLGFLCGLLTLIRPTNIIFSFIPLLYGISNFQNIKERFLKVKLYPARLVLLILAFVLPILPQLFYWKAITGHWLVYSYLNENFFFLKPHLIDGLFGFRKGVFVYTPILLLAVAGFYKLKKSDSLFFLPIVIILPLLTFIILSWWCWWYGGSFGNRAFIDMYPLLTLPLGNAIYHYTKKNNFVKGITLIVIELLICLNIFQSWQYATGALHYDSMTKESYVEGFLQQNSNEKWFSCLWSPDYPRASKGLNEVFKEKEFFNIKVGLYAKNFHVVSAELTSNPAKLDAIRWAASDWETFTIIPVKGKSVNIKAFNNKYICADLSLNNILTASRDIAGKWETFTLDYYGNNQISLKACNGKYVRFDEKSWNQLVADADSLNENCLFRLFTAYN